MNDEKTGLKFMRAAFPEENISMLPKPTKAQTDAVKDNVRSGVRCKVCGGWHHPDVQHLPYVGHAAITERLLSCDEAWFWEPLALTAQGLPAMDADGGLWIKLTVCGVTRYGYGDAGQKKGPDAMKERIGDALRNAAMRFGAALDLWHKGELIQSKDNRDSEPEDDEGSVDTHMAAMQASKTLEELKIAHASAVSAAGRDREALATINAANKAQSNVIDMATVMTDDRFAKALEAAKSGKFPAEKLKKWAMSESQQQAIAESGL